MRTNHRSLKNKRVVITGGASGIGLATAQRFIEEESIVAILDINKEGIEQSIKENPGIAKGYVVDVSNPENVNAVFENIKRDLGGVDVFIANAGISIRNKFLDISPEQWNKVLNINLNGVFYTSQAAAKIMVEQGKGVILMTASTNGVTGHPFYADYNASKAGVNLLAKTMALELAPNIRVNTICPGYVLTPMQMAEYTPAMLEVVNEGIPLKRHADPQEVGALYAFLASDDSSYITGQAIAIDGGELA
ncbi:SDR family oxidoreductase [Lysinibacillus irui]|uniref:SDR family oxidoreductase n=1 Tax=Lysinibacillus irui TaxID=2998077 RepID=A0ABU5NH68_9BACI|nr:MULTISPECIES: SDR family oxidoreductase [Lysinibacillus]MEA0552743.1 SDR family oxidoreductase [Lysinibacillus irui]MEA0565984.1 SDR family oxidoreductase [Lysinibacillus irui]MEA0975323.1 SDR family oxidoreductase [Lysinibacillus irui]MEA1041477.1 SDR family oxidoreductase [Lysinibacillus irui]